jgi:hypothetical protein
VRLSEGGLDRGAGSLPGRKGVELCVGEPFGEEGAMYVPRSDMMMTVVEKVVGEWESAQT